MIHFHDFLVAFTPDEITQQVLWACLCAPLVEEVALWTARKHLAVSLVLQVSWAWAHSVLFGGTDLLPTLTLLFCVVRTAVIGRENLVPNFVAHATWNAICSVVYTAPWLWPAFSAWFVNVTWWASEGGPYGSMILTEMLKGARQPFGCIYAKALEKIYNGWLWRQSSNPYFMDARMYAQEAAGRAQDKLILAGCAALEPLAAGCFGCAVWLVTRWFGRRCRVPTYCDGVHARLKPSHGGSRRARVFNERCNSSWFYQIGPTLPERTPLLYTSCSHNLSQGLARRMLVERPSKPHCWEDADHWLRVLTSRYFDSTPLAWDYWGFLAGKPGSLVRRANNGLTNLVSRGAVVDHDRQTIDLSRVANIRVRSSLFVKREFYDYEPYLGKEPKPRVISGCTDEVLAILGPYYHSMDHKLRSLVGLVKHVCPADNSAAVREIVDKSNLWKRHVISSDLKNYDASQGESAMILQSQLFAAMGLPEDIVAWQLENDITWRGSLDSHRRSGTERSVKYNSADGGRKSGDPQTSTGNNLFHWFVIASFCLAHKSTPDDARFIINGDDFLGVFRSAGSRAYLAHLAGFGLECEFNVGLEFCGGFFLGEQCSFCRDPSRMFFKFGWSHSNDLLNHWTTAQVMHACAICATYHSAGAPIASAVVARTLELCSGDLVASISMRKTFFLLHQAGFLQVPGVNPGFTTEVDFDCRCDYADLFGIPPGLQVCFERAVSDLPLMGELPLFLSRLMS
jgi:hypothetical protein